MKTPNRDLLARKVLVMGLAAIGLLAISSLPAALGAKPAEGPVAYAPGAEPGTDKGDLIAREQAEFEKALLKSMAPIQGPPVEDWHPEVIEGFVPDAASPYEGSRSFTVVNAWQSALSPAGTFTTIYAGDEDGHGLIIVTEVDLYTTGSETRHLEIEMPSQHPRIASVFGRIAAVTDGSGSKWGISLDTGAIIRN